MGEFNWEERLKAEYAELKKRYEKLRAHNICHNFSKEQLECGFYYCFDITGRTYV